MRQVKLPVLQIARLSFVILLEDILLLGNGYSLLLAMIEEI